MPARVNGIGTGYYGKKNLDARQDRCEKCNRFVELTSYDTWLCFSVFFIPVLPLGQKRILDYCPSCTTHRAMFLKEWNKVKADSIKTAAAAMEANPDSAEAAVKLHATLHAFSQRAEAASALQHLEDCFADDADTCLYVAAVHEREHRPEKAEAALERALRLAPDNVEVMNALTAFKAERGDLDGAEAMLKRALAADSAGRAFTPGPHLALAQGYQKANRHADALRHFEILLQKSPALAKDKAFRKVVRASEKAQQKTVLPASSFLASPVFLSVAVCAAVVLLLIGLNVWFVGAETLYIVNDTGTTATVAFDGGASFEAGKGRMTVNLPEGDHTAVVTYGGGSSETVDLRISNTFWTRFFDQRIFVLNVGGAATLLTENATYVPEGQDLIYSTYQVSYGRPFLMFSDIDYVFKECPEHLQIKEGKITKRRSLTIMREDPVDALDYLPDSAQTADYLNFMEHLLRRNSNHSQLLSLYCTIAETDGQTDRSLKTLQSRLDVNPVEVEWHLSYQNLMNQLGRFEELRAEYENRLAASPQNSDLEFLCGCCTPSASDAVAHFDKAVVLNPKNAYALASKGLHFLQLGMFQEADVLATLVEKINPRVSLADQLLDECNLAMKRFDVLEKVARKSAHESLDAQYILMDMLIAQGKHEEAAKAEQSFQRVVQREMPGDPEQYIFLSQAHLMYAQADWDRLKQIARQFQDDDVKFSYQLVAALCTADAETAETLMDHTELGEYAQTQLLLSRIWLKAGNPAQAATWRAEAIFSLNSLGGEYARIADMLGKRDAVTLEELNNVRFQSCAFKALVLVTLADKAGEERDAFLTLARALNYDPRHPYHEINNLLDS